jgi:hypothetical protein
MIELETIRSVIVGGLSAHLEIPVVEINTEAPAVYPFITYSFRGPVEFPGSVPAVTFIPAEGDDIIERYTEQPTFRICFNSCSDQQMESLANAIRMHDWFRILGQNALMQGANVAVVQAGKIKCRDALINSVWERRHRLYVTFRTVSLVDMSQTTIQTVNWD